MLMSDSCDEWFQARVEGRRERERGRERGAPCPRLELNVFVKTESIRVQLCDGN